MKRKIGISLLTILVLLTTFLASCSNENNTGLENSYSQSPTKTELNSEQPTESLGTAQQTVSPNEPTEAVTQSPSSSEALDTNVPAATVTPSATEEPTPSPSKADAVKSPSPTPSTTAKPASSTEPTSSVQYSVYVDPVNGKDTNNGKTVSDAVKTLAQAQKIVRNNTAKMQGNITVYLRGGTYQISSTLVLTSKDSGQNGYNVVWKAYNNETPIISGGKSITGWTLYDSSKNIWVANAQGVTSRDFYVNNERATRARFDGTLSGITKTNSGFMFSTGSLPSSFARPQDLELHTNILWQYNIAPIKTVHYSGSNFYIDVSGTAWKLLNTAIGTTAVQPEHIDHLENAYEFIDKEGEWYLNTAQNKIYYKPKSGQSMSNVSAFLGSLEKLINLSGTEYNKVENITFSGITFSHTTWLQASRSEGLNVIQSNIYKNAVMEEGTKWENGYWMDASSAIYGNYVKNITFTGNNFKNLGNGGIHLARATNNSKITKNKFYDCAGTGITLGGFNFIDHSNGTSDKYFSRYNVIEDNYIDNVGTIYKSACGILAGYVGNTSISYNTMVNLPYTGISLGWGWGFNGQEVNGAFPLLQGANSVCNNYIENVMTYMWDGGAIYTLGRMDGSEIKNNYINKVNNDFGGIYLDNGSQGFTVTNNVLSNCYRNWIYKGNKNYLYNNYTSPGAQQPDIEMYETYGTQLDYKIENNYMWDTSQVNAIKVAAGVRG